MITYIRKNAMFVGLLTVLIVVSICFGGYTLIQKNEHNEVVLPPDQEEPTVNDAEIAEFEGSYGSDASVHLSWSIKRNNHELKSVKLFHDGKQIGGEMKDLSSFEMAQSLYQFPAGNCKFTLQAEFDENTTLTKDVNVFIRYVMNIEMEHQPVKNGVLLKLKYAYDEQSPVSVPRIKFTNGSNVPFSVSYQATKKKINGTIVHAETTFQLNTQSIAPGSYPVTIRWIFEGLNISKDFEIIVTKE